MALRLLSTNASRKAVLNKQNQKIIIAKKIFRPLINVNTPKKICSNTKNNKINNGLYSLLFFFKNMWRVKKII